MVRWFDPVLLLKLLNNVVLSSIFGQYADRRLIIAALDTVPLDEHVKRTESDCPRSAALARQWRPPSPALEMQIIQMVLVRLLIRLGIKWSQSFTDKVSQKRLSIVEWPLLAQSRHSPGDPPQRGAGWLLQTHLCFCTISAASKIAARAAPIPAIPFPAMS